MNYDTGTWKHLVGRIIDSKYRVGDPIHEWPRRVRCYADRLGNGGRVSADFAALGTLSDAARFRFRRNGEMLIRVFSPPKAPAGAPIDVGVLKDDLLYTVDVALGVPLRSRLTGGHSLSSKDVASVVNSCARSLLFAHSASLVHRAVGPDTVVVEQDFTGAVLLWSVPTFRTAMDQPRAVEGYLAPEDYLGGPFSASTDVYCLGALIYELVTGKTPYSEYTTPERVSAIVNNRMPTPIRALDPHCPRPLDDLVTGCLAVKQENRPSLVELMAVMGAL